jgi:hypothetical protein
MKIKIFNLTVTPRILIFSLFTILLFGVSTALAMDYATYSRDCAANGGSSSIVGGVYKCNFPSGGGSSSSGGSSLGGDVGTILGRALGNALGNALRGDPEGDALRAQKAADAQALAAEEQKRIAEEKERQSEESKQRLLGSLKGVSNSQELSFKGTSSSSGLHFKTGDQEDKSPEWEQYRAWEKYKRDVLAYQELVTKNNPENKENQNWCKSRIPLSTGPNRSNWEARCNPNNKVAKADSLVTPETKTANSVTPKTISTASEFKQSTTVPANHNEDMKTASKRELGLTDLKLGEPGNIPKTPKTLPVGPAPEAAPQVLKDSAGPLSDPNETISAVSQGGFDSKNPMRGKLGVVPKTPETFPIGTKPVVTTEAEVHNNVPAPPKETPSHVERHLITANQTEPTTNPAPEKMSSPLSQKAVADKQVQALSCAINELQKLASGMGKEGSLLRTELNKFLDNVRVDLSKPCSGQPETRSVQTITLNDLTKDAKKKEDHLEGNVLVTRNEETCEVHMDVQHASSLKSASTSRSPGQPFNEGQSIIHMDKSGNIIVAETPAGVEKCLARLSTKGQEPNNRKF